MSLTPTYNQYNIIHVLFKSNYISILIHYCATRAVKFQGYWVHCNIPQLSIKVPIQIKAIGVSNILWYCTQSYIIGIHQWIIHHNTISVFQRCDWFIAYQWIDNHFIINLSMAKHNFIKGFYTSFYIIIMAFSWRRHESTFCNTTICPQM